MSARPIRLYHRGRTVELAAAPPTRSVLDWLREDQRLTGTKEGCNEGDCGACTVVLGTLDAQGALQLASVNACTLFLPQLDGKALFTVEDLAPHGAALHPVQQALVDHHGSQCGFCTPGIVMSLWACRERHAGAGGQPTRQELADELAGNLCRCTGYRPILDAAQAAMAAPGVHLDRGPVVAALQQLAADPPLADPGRVQVPHTLAAFAALRADRPEARIVAGATDVALWVHKQLRMLPELLLTSRVAELQRVDERDGQLHIGAGASLESAWGALASRWPALHELWLRFASPPVRHAGTMGGNIANGSPIGDAAPVLMALDARVVLQHRDRLRELPLDRFYLGYQRNALQPGEFLRELVLPLPQPGQVLRAYKVSKRFDSDISALCAAFALQLDAGVVREARIAFGGMAATVCRAAGAESALLGRRWDEAALVAATLALAQDFQPITDLRASAGYRRQVAAGLLRRCWLETRPDAPLPAAALSVFAREARA